MLPRLRPRALVVFYSRAFNEPAEVEAEAVYLCEGGRLVKQDEDFFWNGCSLTQPHRINYVCYPPDKAKRLNGASWTAVPVINSARTSASVAPAARLARRHSRSLLGRSCDSAPTTNG